MSLGLRRITTLGRKNPWPDPLLSVGECWCSMGQDCCWEPIGPAKEKFDEISPQIKNILDSRGEYLSEGICVRRRLIFEMYMIGRTAELAKPTIVFSSENKTQCQRAKKLVKESGILSGCPGMGLGDSRRPLRLSRSPKPLGDPSMFSDDTEMSTWTGSSSSLPEASIWYSSQLNGLPCIPVIVKREGPEALLSIRKSTLSAVLIDNELMGLTIAHAFFDESDDESSSGTDLELALDDDDEAEDAFEFADDFINMTSRGSVSPEQWPESSRVLLEKPTWPGKKPGTTSHGETNSNEKNRIETFEAPAKYLGRIFAISLPTTTTNLDWALVRIECADFRSSLPDTIEISRSDHIEPPWKGAKTVHAITGSSGSLAGRITGSSTFIQLPGSTAFQEVWAVKLDGPLRPGDSGSWIIDPSSGGLYGYIVVGDPQTSIAYIVSAHQAFPAIEKQLGSKVTLASQQRLLSLKNSAIDAGDPNSAFPRTLREGQVPGISVPEPMQSQAARSRKHGPSPSPGDEEEDIYHHIIPTSEKRDLEVSSHDSSATSILQTEDEFPSARRARPAKRIKLGGSRPTHLDPEFLLIHQVECGQSINHNHHPGMAYFLDAPRLFAGDNQASPLRGTISITDVEEHLEDNEHISIVIYRTYYCEEYHESIEEGFDGLKLSDYGVRTVSAMRPYLYVLRKDMELATCISEQMTIVSQDLKDALKNLGNLDPRMNYNLFKQDGWSLKAPYLPLYHFQDLIRQTIPRLTNGEEQQHIEVLLRYVDEAFGDEYAEANDLFAKGLVSQKHHSKLFGPHETVVTVKEGHPVASVSRGLPSTGRSNLVLFCESWSFDGVFGRNENPIDIAWPSTSSEILPIVELDLFPLKYDLAGTKQRLLDRGQLLWKCRKRRYMSYRVPSTKDDILTVYPRYMIDMNVYRQMHSVEAGSSPQRDDLGPEAFEREEAPSETFLLLLQTTIQGFGFQDKKWRTLTVEYLHDIDWNVEAFDRLVLKHHKKELIKALVTLHVTTSASTDVIEGKGNGLIMLLLGDPGTGKTLTAESVAELTGKPLYRVACGDIGTNPEDVEKYLEAVLMIGKLWGCIVLLDEADVFLEERSQTDLQRNALVSVFLRVLEYYEGILIITANSIGTFDKAFKSRIQLAIRYPALDEKGRWEIWSNFINSLDRATAKVDELKLKVDVLSRSKLNGRQIRNTVKTAMQLAEFRKEILDYTHFERVLEVADD